MPPINGERVIRIIRDNVGRCGMRADGNINANDFMWALEEAIKQAHDEEKEVTDATG